MNASNTTSKSHYDPAYDSAYQTTKLLVRAITAFVVLLGNSICIAAFLGSKALRKRPHYLLVHLCLADFLVGISVLLRLVLGVLYWKHGGTPIVFETFTFTLDYLSNIASIYVLTSISLERFLAMVFPLFHRMAGNGLYAVLMGVPWGLSCVVTLISILWNPLHVIQKDAFELVYLVVITSPLVVILISYSAILAKVRNDHIQRNNRTLDLRDRKLAVTLLMVTLASVVTWGPYNVYYVLVYYCKSCDITFSSKVFFYLIILQYWNSAVNLGVYFFRMPQFRQVVMNFCRNPKIGPSQPPVTNSPTILHSATPLSALRLTASNFDKYLEGIHSSTRI